MVRLHLGCGNNIYKGWVNIDKYNPEADVQADITSLDCYRNNSIDEIYTCHMVEHLKPDDFRVALKEWYRVLKPGGWVIIRCPYGHIHFNRWLDATDQERYELGAHLLSGICGHFLGGEGHRNWNFFTEGLLRLYMEGAGFKVEKCLRVSNRVCAKVYSRLKRGKRDQPRRLKNTPLDELWCKGIK